MWFSAKAKRMLILCLSAKAPAKTRICRASHSWAEAGSCLINSWHRLTFRAIKNVYIANMVKCRPPKNRDPKPEEQTLCIDWLRAQFKIIRPKIIVCVGRISAQRLISPDFKVTKQHGEFIEKNGVLMMGTYHPAAILRNPNNKEAAFGDWLALRDKINEMGIEI